MRKVIIIVLISIATIFSISGVIFFISVSNNPAFNDGSRVLDPVLSSNFGSFVSGVLGPIFSLASIFLILSSISIQLFNNQKEKFESRIFELLNFHRDNVNTMIIITKKGETYSGRHVFALMRKTLRDLIDISKEINDKNNSVLSHDEIAEVSYLIFFFGLGKNDASALIYNLIDFKSEESTKKYKEVISKILLKVSEEFDLNLLSQQANLGHYFRNLYQIVKYIDSPKYISKKEKYIYVKLLRTQLSQFELVIFFFNLFTKFAQPWKTNKIIERYKFIKNLPRGLCFTYDPKDYFKIKYEWEESQK